MIIVLMNHNNGIEQPIDPTQYRKMSVERRFSKIFSRVSVDETNVFSHINFRS